MAKKINIIKIVAVSLVLLFLISGFSYSIYQNQQKVMNERQGLSVDNSRLGSAITGRSQGRGPATDYVSEYNNENSEIQNNISFNIGNVNSSYLGEIYVPVYLDGSAVFKNLVQVFSYDSNLLKFKGTLNDVASQNISFSYSSLAPDILEVRGNGTFEAIYSTNILYYLVFSPEAAKQVKTSVLLDYSIINNSTYSTQVTSIINIARGWTSYGPRDIPFRLGVPLGYKGPQMSSYGTGITNSIGFSQYYPNIIYEGSGSFDNWGFGGMMKSTDGGLSWATIDLGLTYTQIQAIWVSPSDPNVTVVIADTWGFHGGIFKTVNGGLSWQETYSDGGVSLQYVPGGYLYAFAFHALLVSSNLGSTWKIISSPYNLIISGLVINGGKIIDIADDSNLGPLDIFQSDDGGKTFNVRQGFPSSNFVDMAVDPFNSSIQWLIDFQNYVIDSLYKSTNGGISWKLVNLTAINMSFAITSVPQVITYDPLNSSIIYLGGDAWVCVSDDGGNTFHQMLNIVTAPNTIVIDPSDDSTIYVGGEQGLFVSHDKGNTWEPLNNRSSSIVQGLSIDGKNALVTLGNFIVTYSTDNGSTWAEDLPRYISNGIVYRAEGGVTSVDPFNSSIVLFAAGFMLVSHDGGKNYSFPQIDQAGIDNPALSQMDAFVFVPNSSVIYYAGNAGIYITNDNGYNWSLIPSSPRYCSAIAGIETNGGYVIYASSYSGLFRSNDGGSTWSKINDVSVETMSIDPQNPSIIAATIGTKGEISYNGGEEFSYINESSIQTILLYFYPAVLFQKGPEGKILLYFISNRGIFVSDNLGISWVSISYNLPTKTILSLEFYNSTAYITTQGDGVYYDPLPYTSYFTVNFSQTGLPSGTSWSVTLNGTIQSSSTNTITFTEPNGTYSYVVSSSNSNYSPNPSSGSFTVNGSSVSQSISFSEVTYSVTFTETGLPSGTSWSVTLNNVTETSTNSTITFHEPYGTYSYSISLPPGYRTTSSTGSVITSQSSLNIPVSVSSITPPSSSNSYLIYVMIAVVVIAAVIGTVVAMGRRKK